MRPAARGETNLTACLERCASEVFRGQPVETRVAVSPPRLPLPPEVEIAAYYIAREALFNARKHASPRRVVVSLECRHGIVSVTVSDDGRGFRPEDTGPMRAEAAAAELHRGLRTMHERAQALGGDVCLESRPGHGTRVTATIPL
jgi:signal transduction histidine kinase